MTNQAPERKGNVKAKYMQTVQTTTSSPNSTNAVLAAVAFVEWRDKLHKEVRGGILMYDVPKHYKWLEEAELFNHYMKLGCYCG